MSPYKLVLLCVIFLVTHLQCVESLDFDYHNNTMLEEILRNFSTINHNSIRTKLYSIGKTKSVLTIPAKDLWVFEITASNKTIGVPNIKLIGGVFGNEPLGTEILLHFIDYLISSYSSDEKVKYLLENTIIHILPRMNPSGYPLTSGNILQYPLNAMYPDVYGGSSKFEPQSESDALMKWMKDTYFVLSATLNSGNIGMIIYPYNTLKHFGTKQFSLTPDNDVFLYLSNIYAQKNKNNLVINNGAAKNPQFGTMQDYNYFKHGCMELNIRLRSIRRKNFIEKCFEDNKNSLVQYCLQANQGIYGVVKDKETKKPVQARFKILERDMEFQTNNNGEFWKILLNGTYKIEVKADGYYKKIETFEVDSIKPLPELKHLEIFLINSNEKTTTTESNEIKTSIVDYQQIPEVQKLEPIFGASTSAGGYILNSFWLFSLSFVILLLRR